jgi:transcriptional regulator with XRE-family HTH domain
MPALNEQRRVVNDDFNLVVGANIKRWRLSNGLTLMELAAVADMDFSVLNRIENGERSIKFREATCIAHHFGVKVESLCKKQSGVSYNR